MATRMDAQRKRVPTHLQTTRPDRGLSEYVRQIREGPGFGLKLIAAMAIAASNWTTAGARVGLAALCLGLLCLYPIGYLVWRRGRSR